MAKNNYFFGFLNSLWTVLVSVCAIPFYIDILGTEAYGFIGFYITLLALFHLLDMGMTPTINREVSRYKASDKLEEVSSLFYSLSVIYWIISLVICLSIFFGAEYIVSGWLKFQQITKAQAIEAVSLMGVLIGIRLPCALYQAVLIGSQEIRKLCGINILVITTGTFLTIVSIKYISNSLFLFFLCQIAVNLTLAFIFYKVAWKIIGRSARKVFSYLKVKNVVRFSLGMGGVAVSGALLIQLDKVVLSKLLDMSEFGLYSLAVVVASVLYLFLTPLYNVIYPRLTALLLSNTEDEVIEIYRNWSHYFFTFFLPVSFFLSVFSEEILFLWLADEIVAESVSEIATVFIFGTMLNGIMHFPYALQLAYSNVAIPLKINVLLLMIMVPIVYVMANAFGAIGGAYAWCCTNLIYVVFGTFYTHRFLFKGVASRWLLEDLATPMLVSSVCVGGIGFYMKSIDFNTLGSLALGLFLTLITVFVIFLFSKRVRLLFLYEIKNAFNINQ